MSVLVVLLATILLIFVVRLVQIYPKWVRVRKIPCPPEKFLTGHLHILRLSPDIMIQKIREYSKTFFPIYRFSTFYVNIVNILDPNDIEIVLSTTKHLEKSKIYTFLSNWLGTGLLTSTGEKWHKRRKILTPSFHFTILKEFVEIFNVEAEKLVEKLSKEDVLDVVPPITSFTLQSILETAMGLNGVEETQTKIYKQAIYDIADVFMKRLQNPWYRISTIYNMSKIGKSETGIVKILHNFSNNIIEKRHNGTISTKKRKAMLDLLISAKNNGADIAWDGIREEVDTFMFEGHDTTSMAISFFLLALANLPEVQMKVLDEILRVVGSDGTPNIDSLQDLKYTERCIKETLRLFPSVPLISRYASEDFTTETGYFIPKNTVLHIHIFDILRNETLFPDPLKFDPDRFLVENSSKRHPFAYIPFSAGPRNCIGQKFAILEIKTVICWILRRFKLERIDDMNDIEFKPDLVLRPKNEVRIKIVPRHGYSK